MARRAAPVRTTLLCAIKFWSASKDGKTPTLRRGVRHVVRTQGFSPAAINRAERELVREGKIAIGGARMGKTIRLLDDVSCGAVKLSPWTDDGQAGASFSGPARCNWTLAKGPYGKRKFLGCFSSESEAKNAATDSQVAVRMPPPGVPLMGGKRKRRR